MFACKRTCTFNTFSQLTQMPVRYRRRGASFRKNLGVYSFKIRKQQYYKNPHAMSVFQKEKFKNAGTFPVQRIAEAERESIRPFGKISNKGGFKMDIDLIPFYNVPDLRDFKLKPYVPHITPKVPQEIFEPKITELPAHIKELKLAPEVFEPVKYGEENLPQSK